MLFKTLPSLFILIASVYRARKLIPSLQIYQNKNQQVPYSKYNDFRESYYSYILNKTQIEQRKSNYQQKPFGTCLEMPLPVKYVEQGQIRPCCPARDDQCFYIPKDSKNKDNEECFCDEFCMLNGDCCADYYDVCMWIYEDNLDEPREVLIDTNRPSQLLMLAMSHVGLYKYGKRS